MGTNSEKGPLISRQIRYFLGSAAALVLLWLAFRGTDLQALRITLARLHPAYVIAAVATMFLSVVLRAWRWQRLFQGEVPPLWTLIKGISIGQTLNFVIPLRAGDVARAVLIKGRRLHSAGTLAVEKVLDMVFFALLCLVAPAFWAMPQWLEKPRASLLIMAVGALLAALALLIPKRTREYIRHKRALLPELAIATAVIWAAGAMINWLVFSALELPVPWMAAVVLLVILQIGVAVPSTPGKVGVLQYLAVLGLGLFGVGKTDALAAGLILHVVVFVPVALAALAFWLAED